MNDKTDVRQRARELQQILDARSLGYTVDTRVLFDALERAIAALSSTEGGEAVAEVVSLRSDNYGHHHRIKWTGDRGPYPVGTKLYTHPAPQPVSDDVYEAYKTWPEDIRKKLSLYDLRRMGGWARKTKVSDWRLDTSTGTPILVYKDCSVIEGEDARYVLGLIEKGKPFAGDAVRELPNKWRTEPLSGVNTTHELTRTSAKMSCADELEAALRSQPASRRVPEGLIDALRNQRQVDEDGIECGVSREAVDAAITILSSLAASPHTDIASDGMEFFTLPIDLHPNTANLVARFATALAAKLAAAEKKYGYSNGWADPNWMDECRQKLAEHVAKGDPRDVAAYCAFLWHHGESTTPSPASGPDFNEPDSWSKMFGAAAAAPVVDDNVRRFIMSNDLYSLLTDVQNGIDSPATCSIANHLIIKLNRVRAALTQGDSDGR